MKITSWMRCLGLVLMAGAMMRIGHGDSIAQSTVDPAESPRKIEFGRAQVWTIEIEVSAAEYTAMQPTPGAGFGAPRPPAPKDVKKRSIETNLFGTQFPWVESNITLNGTKRSRVGLRYSGDITYFNSALAVKRPLRIGFDRFGGEAFQGMSGIQLQAMPLDPAKSRQWLASHIFTQAGVPTPRTAFAEVTFSVPGRYDKEFLGLYTVVEEIDDAFLTDRFGSNAGLLMRPFGTRGLDHFGMDWSRYSTIYRPQRDPTAEEKQRLIDFTALVNQAKDDDFQKRIGEFVEVEAFLRFMAANTVTANLESFFALGHNYTLYLHPKSKRFHFIPGDLEFSFAHFMLMGTAAQLMDLNILKPYPGENRLADRLLAIPAHRERYLRIVHDLTDRTLANDRLTAEVEAIEQRTAPIRAKEAKAAQARREPMGGFGGPGAAASTAPNLKTFAKARESSIRAQLAGKSQGFTPTPLQFGGPPPGGGAVAQARAIDERTFQSEVKVPNGFEATLFAAPPKVNSPVAIACEPTGAIYVAVDEQGSLGRNPGGGRIIRLMDKDGDGKADTSTVFARMEHPRGVVYRNGQVWVCHPPQLSVYRDTDGDGVADQHEVLVTGLTTNQINDRGGDHTTNGVRMGIDGWLYIGVGDYGIQLAKGKDGRTITMRGGGVIRVRPDGTELEIYCTGLRNPFDLAIDPFLNIFTRDNTNDGAGWDTRVSLLKQSAMYGYTQLFANFTDEIMPTLGTFGNGGGTGAVMMLDPRWPEPFRGALLTGDWGRSEVYHHPLKANGPTFDLQQQSFLTVPRATGMDMNADGELFIASWRGGEASVFVGPNVGFIARVVPKGLSQSAFPDLAKLDQAKLIALFSSENAIVRFHAQGEVLARGRSASATTALLRLIGDEQAQLECRVLAIFTLKQLDGVACHRALSEFSKNPSLCEFILRALTDRLSERTDIDTQVLIRATTDPAPRIRAQAAISIGRLGDPALAAHLLPLTARADGSQLPTRRPIQNQPDPGRVVPHLAVRALVALNAGEACIAAIDGPHASGGLWALRYLHNANTVDGLIKKLNTVRTPALRREMLTTLIRLYHREAEYTGTWWGIRPDSSGPYYDRVEWALSQRIGAVITAAFADADVETANDLKAQLARHKVSLPGVRSSSDAVIVVEKPFTLPKADPNNPDQLANMAYDVALRRTRASTGDPKKGEFLFRSQSCIACHTTADGQTPKGPHLFEIGKRYNTDELLESILKPSAKLAQGFESYRVELTNGRVVQGFIVGELAQSTKIRQGDGVQLELKKTDIESRTLVPLSAMPEGLAANLTPQQLADLIAYLQSLK